MSTCSFGSTSSRAVAAALALLAIGACSSDSGKTASNGAPTQGTSGSSAASSGTPASSAASGSGTGGKPAQAMNMTTAAAGTSSAPKAGNGSTAQAGNGATAAGNADADGGSPPSSQGSGGSMGTTAGACTREALRAAVDAYYAALTAHTTDKLSLAANVKYTENAKMLMPGEGVWKTAGMLKFKRTAVDTMTCQTATESVIPDGSTDRVYGVRLKLDGEGKISEIEGILVTDYILIMPAGLVSSKDDDWETVLPADKQMPRDKMQAVMDKYLKEFPSGACGFASSCKRLEDGGSVGTCVDGSLVTCNMMDRPNMNVLKPLNHVIDLEAGIVVGFTVFLGGYDDFHLFKMRDGQVQAVHAVLTQTDSKTGWE